MTKTKNLSLKLELQQAVTHFEVYSHSLVT